MKTLLLALALFHVACSGSPPTYRLNDGNSIPGIALGTWLGHIGAVRIEPKPDEVVKAVEWAIDAGYRHIDTAHIYNTEEQVGRAIANKIREGVVKREDLFITTKLWNDRHAKEEVLPALRESLQKLGLTYVDLYLIHWPTGQFSNGSFDMTHYTDTWRGMQEAKANGLTNSIGLSNFNRKQMGDIHALDGVKPAVLQVEVNLNLQQPELLEYAKQHNITVMGYTPFGSLFPSKAQKDAPPPRVDDPALVAMADKYGKTVTQIALRFLVELGVVPIPKSVTKHRIEQNFDIFDFELSEEDKNALRSYNRNYRTIAILRLRDSPYYPFADDFVKTV